MDGDWRGGAGWGGRRIWPGVHPSGLLVAGGGKFTGAFSR
jgi:hypothetical protein